MTEREREEMRAGICGMLADYSTHEGSMGHGHALHLAEICERYELPTQAAKLRTYAAGALDAMTGNGLSFSGSAELTAAYLAGARSAWRG